MSSSGDAIHPRARGLASAAGTLGALICCLWPVLAAAWVIVLLPLFWRSRSLRSHLVFLAAIVLPIGIVLLAVWGWFVGAPPNAELQSDPPGGAEFALLVILRLMMVGGIWQLCFVTLSSLSLARTLRNWGLGGDSILVAVCTLNVLPDVRRRAEQVLTARAARGLGSSGVTARLLDLPKIFLPLVAWALRSAIERGKVIQQRRLLARYDLRSAADAGGLPLVWNAKSVGITVLALTWLVTNLGLMLW